MATYEEEVLRVLQDETPEVPEVTSEGGINLRPMTGRVGNG